MKKNSFGLIFIFLITILISCNTSNEKDVRANQNSNQNSNQKNQKKKKQKTAIKKSDARPYLTNENADAFLLDYGKKNKENKIVVKTKFGDIKIRLYKDTPIHRANMIYLAKNNFYKNSQFYRVIQNFMIQAGQSDDDEIYQRRKKFGNYKLKSEIQTHHFHKRGALAMGRNYDDYNKDKRSSSYNFYIVQGKVLTTWEINAIANTYCLKIPDNHRKVYRSIGGSPHIDGDHTVFGEVYEGFSVIDSIAAVKTDEGNWPINNVYLDVQVLNE